MDAATADPSERIDRTAAIEAQRRRRYTPILPRPRPPEPPSPPRLVDQRPAPSFSNASRNIVTPDEVLTLGVLALTGLWPGVWSGIAAIIVKQVDQLSKVGAADIPFRRCATSLVEMLLATPGDPTIAVGTWRHLAAAKARLPDDLSQVLDLASSLLQSRTMEAAHSRSRKKRRRNASADTITSMSAPPHRLTPPSGTALTVMVSNIAQEEEREAKETHAKQEVAERRNKIEREASIPPFSAAGQLLQPSLPGHPTPRPDVGCSDERNVSSPSPHQQTHSPMLAARCSLVQSEPIQNGKTAWRFDGSPGEDGNSVAGAVVDSAGAVFSTLAPPPQSPGQKAGSSAQAEYCSLQSHSPVCPDVGHRGVQR